MLDDPGRKEAVASCAGAEGFGVVPRSRPSAGFSSTEASVAGISEFSGDATLFWVRRPSMAGKASRCPTALCGGRRGESKYTGAAGPCPAVFPIAGETVSWTGLSPGSLAEPKLRSHRAPSWAVNSVMAAAICALEASAATLLASAGIAVPAGVAIWGEVSLGEVAAGPTAGKNSGVEVCPVCNCVCDCVCTWAGNCVRNCAGSCKDGFSRPAIAGTKPSDVPTALPVEAESLPGDEKAWPNC